MQARGKGFQRVDITIWKILKVIQTCFSYKEGTRKENKEGRSIKIKRIALHEVLRSCSFLVRIVTNFIPNLITNYIT